MGSMLALTAKDDGDHHGANKIQTVNLPRESYSTQVVKMLSMELESELYKLAFMSKGNGWLADLECIFEDPAAPDPKTCVIRMNSDTIGKL
eukprot:4353964-Pyramimonas_sp.AAC.1